MSSLSDTIGGKWEPEPTYSRSLSTGHLPRPESHEHRMIQICDFEEFR